MPNIDVKGRPRHPQYGAALGGATQTVDGVEFYPYRRGIGLYIRVSQDGRIAICEVGKTGSSFHCSVDGLALPKKFRLFATAAAAGIAKRDAS